MKRITTFSFICACFTLASCSTSKYANVNRGTSYSKLLTVEAQSTKNVTHDMANIINLETSKTICFKAKGTVPVSHSQKSVMAYIDNGIKGGNFAKTTHSIYKYLQTNNLANMGINIIKVHKATASFSSYHQSMTLDHKLWMIITLAATVVFLALSILFVHGTLGLIFGILLLISFFAFLIFLGLYLWEKHKARMNKTKQAK